MPHDRSQPATPVCNPAVTGAYVAESTPDPDRNQPTGRPRGGVSGDLPEILGYVVTGEIARGGMGRVLAATDLAFGREVAVKVMLPGFASDEAAGRFVRESRITGRLAHPGIPPAYQLGQLADGSPFLAMKLVRGRTLATLLGDRPSPTHDLPRFVGVFEQIAQAVGFAHSEGVIHRDLKPANVMVGAFGEVQVMDWGLARERGDDRIEGGSRGDPAAASDASLTAAGAIMGTPAYMAPEQARGEDVGVRADVFALGGILCEVLTGTRPFRGESGVEVLRKSAAGDLAEAFARLDGCGADPELIDVAKRCLSADPSGRPADGSATAVLTGAYRAGVEARLQRAEMDRAAGEARAAEEANTRREAEARAAEQLKRKRVQLAAAVIFVAGAGGVAVWRVYEAGVKRAEVVRLEGEEQARRTRAADAVRDLLDQAEAELRAGNAGGASPFLDQAGRRATTDAVPDHAARLAALRSDLLVLHSLDAADDFRWTPLGTAYPSPDLVVKKWSVAFAGYGIVPGMTPPAEAAARVAGSPVRRPLVAALDRWLARAPSAALRELVDAADPDPFRAEVRRVLAARDRVALAALAGRAEWQKQPAEMVRVFAGATPLPAEAVRDFLTHATIARAADFGLLMDLGFTYQIDAKDTAGERVRWYQAAVALRPANGAARMNLGVALLTAGKLDDALVVYREAIRLAPTQGPPHFNLGYALSAKGDPAGAIACYREALAHAPGHAETHYNLGNMLRLTKNPAAAEASYREAVRLRPAYPNAHSNLGVALADQNRLDEAAAAFRAALRLDPGHDLAHYYLGLTLLRQGRPAEAVTAFRDATRVTPQKAEVHYSLGAALLGTKDAAGALPCFREAVRLDPADAAAHLGLGNALRDTGKADDAIPCYRDAIRLDPRLAAAHFNLGCALGKRGRVNDAEACFREAIRLDPTAAAAHVELGNAFRQKRELDDAIAAYREAIRLAPTLADAHHHLAITLKQDGQLAAAIAAYREAARLSPADARLRTNLGNALRANRESGAAIAAYREAVRLDPTFADAHNNLGNALREQEEWAAAVAAYREAARHDPRSAMYPFNLGVALEHLGDMDGAAAGYREAARLDPRLAPAHALLGGLYHKQGRHAEAAAAYRAAIAAQPNLGFAHDGLDFCLRVQRGEVPTAPPPRAVTR